MHGQETFWTAERRRRHRRGHAAEWAAAAYLILKGYRVLARRQRTSAGEIDLIAVRGNRLAFVEVKARRTLEEAQAAISRRQRQRVRRAAGLWLARNPRRQGHETGFDLLFLVPGRWPVHIENGL